MDYKAVRAELIRRRENIRYFNRDFYAAFLKAREAAKKAGPESEYYRDGIRLCHAWDAVYKSRFYRENGGAYCVFLEIV